MNDETSVVNLFTDLCVPNSELRKTMKEFEAALKKNTEINEQMSQHYSPLIRRAKAVSVGKAVRGAKRRAGKRKRATAVRNTLIKSIVFACKGFDYLQAKLMIPDAESYSMKPPRPLRPARLLETLGILPTKMPIIERFLGFPESMPTDKPAAGTKTVQVSSTGSDLQEPIALKQSDSA